MFHKSKLMFWTSEVLLLTIIFFIWRQMGDMITPIVSVVNTILIPFLVGGFLYYITNPLVKFLQEKGQMAGDFWQRPSHSCRGWQWQRSFCVRHGQGQS